MANSLTKIKTNAIDDDAVTLAKQAAGTDGQIITYDASGNPVAVGPGTDGQVLTSTGAGSPPAFEALPTQISLANDANNRVITGTGSGLNGEANLTFDGSVLNITGQLEADTITGPAGSAGNFSIASGHADTPFIFYVGQFGVSAAEKLRIDSSGRVLIGTTTEGHSDADALTIASTGGYTGITLRSDTGQGGAIYFSDATSGAGEYDGQVLYSQNSQTMVLATAGVGRLNIESGGNVKINDGDLVIGTAGHGIDFSAQTQSTSSTGSEVLNHYEEGTWTPINKSGQSVDGVAHNGAFNIGGGGARYTRIGNTVHICVDTFTMENTGGNYGFVMGGLPFTNVAVNRGLGDLVTTDAQAHKGLIVSNTTYIYFYPENSTTASTNANVSQAVIYGITGTYTV